MTKLIIFLMLFTSLAFAQEPTHKVVKKTNPNTGQTLEMSFVDFDQDKLERMYDNTYSFIKDKLSTLPQVKNWDNQIAAKNEQLEDLKKTNVSIVGVEKKTDEELMQIELLENELNELKAEKEDFESGKDLEGLKAYLEELRVYTLERSSIGATKEQLQKVEDLKGVYLQMVNYINLRSQLANADCLDKQNDFKEHVLTFSRSEITNSLCTGYSGPQLKGDVLSKDFGELLDIVNKTNSNYDQANENIADYVIVPLDKKSDYEDDSEKAAWRNGQIALSDHLKFHKDNLQDRKQIADISKMNKFYQDAYFKNLENLTKQFIENDLRYGSTEAREKLMPFMLDTWNSDNGNLLSKFKINKDSFPLKLKQKSDFVRKVQKHHCGKISRKSYEFGVCSAKAEKKMADLEQSIKYTNEKGPSFETMAKSKKARDSYAYKVSQKFCHKKMDVLARSQCTRKTLPWAMEQVELTVDTMKAQSKDESVVTPNWMDMKVSVNSTVDNMNGHIKNLNNQKIKKQRKILDKTVPSFGIGKSAMNFETDEQKEAYGNYMESFNKELTDEKEYGKFFLNANMNMVPRDKEDGEEDYHAGGFFKFNKLDKKEITDVVNSVYATQKDFLRAGNMLGSDYSNMYKNFRTYDYKSGIGADNYVSKNALNRLMRTNPQSVAHAIMKNAGHGNSLCQVISGIQEVVDEEQNLDNTLMAAEIGTALIGGVGIPITRWGVQKMGRELSKGTLKNIATTSSVISGTSGLLGGIDGAKHKLKDVPEAERMLLLARTGYQSSNANSLETVSKFAKELDEENTEMQMATGFFVLGDLVVFNEIKMLNKELKAIDEVAKPSLNNVQKFERHLSKSGDLKKKYTDALKDLYPDNKSMARILNQYLAQLSPSDLKKFEKLLDKPEELAKFKDVLARMKCTKTQMTGECLRSFKYIVGNYKKPLFQIPEIAKAEDAKGLFKSTASELTAVDQLVSKTEKLQNFMLTKTPDEQAIIGEMIAVHMRSGKGTAKIIDELEQVKIACK